MNDITYAVSVDVNNPIISYNVYVASVLDSNVRYLEITLYQNGNVIALSDTATATASLVTDNVLVNGNVNCTISDNIITVPLEDLQRHGNLDIQVTVTEDTKVLAIPFPIQVRVAPNIAENAQVDENSLGSYAEVVHEISEARGLYDKLKDHLDHIEAATEAIRTKQDKLTAGQNITITEENVISASSGSNDYTDLTNKPSINNVTLSGNKSSGDLNLQGKLTAGENITIEDNVISAEGGVTSYDDLTDKPSINDISLEGNKSARDLGLQGIIENYFTVENNEYLEYDFNSISLPSSNSVMYCIPFTRIRNFPNSLSDKILQSGILYIFHYVHSVVGAMYLIRRIMGQSPSGNYAEFAQYCTVTGSSDSVIYSSDWVELSGDSQIVSGVVNANGTITFTDSEGNSFTTSGSNLVTSGNEQISMGYDEGGFYFLFDDGQEEVNNGTN